MPSLRGAEAADLSQSKTSLLYIASSRLARPTERDPCSNKLTKNYNKINVAWYKQKLHSIIFLIAELFNFPGDICFYVILNDFN